MEPFTGNSAATSAIVKPDASDKKPAKIQTNIVKPAELVC